MEERWGRGEVSGGMHLGPRLLERGWGVRREARVLALCVGHDFGAKSRFRIWSKSFGNFLEARPEYGS
eukprot:4333142-Pleurochrysis_carterae.AAC.4